MNWLRAMIVELFAIIAIICIQILGLFWRPKLISKNQGTPILLVHGYINTGAIWLYIKRKIKNFGPIYTIDLKEPFASIVEHAHQVDRLADRIEKETGKKELILIGYSMGGLVSTYYATKLAPKGKVQRIIAIATPFSGTKMALIAVGKNAKEMRVGSLFLRQLDHTGSLVTIASKTDEIVVPYSSALIDGAKQFLVDNLGHGALIFSPRIAKVIINELKLCHLQ